MLRVVDQILALIVKLAPIVAQIERRDRMHAAQIRNALNSALLNAAEGSGQRGARGPSHRSIAYGSTCEVSVALKASIAWGHIAPLSPALVDESDHVRAILWKCAHPKS